MAKCYSCAVLLSCSFTTRHDGGGIFVMQIVSVHSLQLLSDLKDRMWDKKVCVCACTCECICVWCQFVCACIMFCIPEQCWLSL